MKIEKKRLKSHLSKENHLKINKKRFVYNYLLFFAHIKTINNYNKNYKMEKKFEVC